MAGPGGSVSLGAIQPNNVPPALGAVAVPADNVEGTPVQFATSATGPTGSFSTIWRIELFMREGTMRP